MITGLIIGLFVGVPIGIFFMCLLVVASEADAAEDELGQIVDRLTFIYGSPEGLKKALEERVIDELASDLPPWDETPETLEIYRQAYSDEEIARAGEVDEALSAVACESCNGSGAGYSVIQDRYVKCSECDGKGER